MFKWLKQKLCKHEYTHLFNPSEPITREYMCELLYRFATLIYGVDSDTDNSLSQFPDVSKINSNYVHSVAWSNYRGLITGDKGKINPQGTATRGQFAKMLIMTVNSVNEEKSYINSNIPKACIDYMNYGNGYLTISGWTFDYDYPLVCTSLAVYIGNNKVYQFTTDLSSDDVNNAYGIQGMHRFNKTVYIGYEKTDMLYIKTVDMASRHENVCFGTVIN